MVRCVPHLVCQAELGGGANAGDADADDADAGLPNGCTASDAPAAAAVGAGPKPPAEIAAVAEVAKAEVSKEQGGRPQERAANALVAKALSLGSLDNITAVVLSWTSG